MVFIIAGGILLLASIGLFVAARHQQRRLQQMALIETSTSDQIRELAESVTAEIGMGSFSEIVEVKGTIECVNSLTSELSETPCIYYSMKVTREYEETFWAADGKGNQSQRTRRGSEVVSRNTRSTPFTVRDEKGVVNVDPEGASFIAEKVLSRFETGDRSRGSLTFGNFKTTLGAVTRTGGRRTIGYRFEESAIPVGREIYVLGEAADSDGHLSIRKPAETDTPFIVSLKSEEELARRARRLTSGLRSGAWAGCAFGAAGVIVGIISSI